jgi:hypothetical protein
MRAAALLLLFAAALPAPGADPPRSDFLQAVEFPYYLYPRPLWERELVWLKAIGIRTVEFPIPWNWHQIGAGEFDFNGVTSPRRDLMGLIRLLRRLDLHAWIRPLPPVAGWLDEGVPQGANEAHAQRLWTQSLERLLATQTASHGGPIAYVDRKSLSIDAEAPPGHVTVISAIDPGALPRSRDVIAGAPGRGALLWTGVEDALYPEGWSSSQTLLRKGAVGLDGNERPATAALRRNAALLRHWGPLLSGLQPVAMPKPAAGKLPAGVTAVELVSPVGSAVSIVNRGTEVFHDDLRVVDPVSRRTLVVPGVTVPSGDSLWLPLGVSIGPDGLCRECSNFSGAENIVYATAELLSIEFENGILAMEFAAPEEGEVILQLARKPVGPYLAAGRPSEFDWDDKTLRLRLKIPAGRMPGNRVRIGIAIEEPETSAFFNDLHRLLIGRKNLVSTTYSSADVAKRSRLLLPEGFTATAQPKSPNEIEYEINVPQGLAHGDWANLALEVDGMPLGRARVQLFRPASVRLTDAIQLRLGPDTVVTGEPAVGVIEPKAGTNLEIAIRNNDPGIRTYHLAASGQGLEFFPAKTEISVAGTEERRLNLRVFASEPASGLLDWHLRVTGGADLDLPMRVLLLPRGQTVAWTADLDGDGSPEWILESQKVRAVFSTRDGGRWMEFTWKDTGVNFLPEQGIFAAPGTVEVQNQGDTLQFSGKGWKRTVRLAQTTLSIEQTSALPPDGLSPEKRGGATLKIERPAAGRTVYTLSPQ